MVKKCNMEIGVFLQERNKAAKSLHVSRSPNESLHNLLTSHPTLLYATLEGFEQSMLQSQLHILPCHLPATPVTDMFFLLFTEEISVEALFMRLCSELLDLLVCSIHGFIMQNK